MTSKVDGCTHEDEECQTIDDCASRTWFEEAAMDAYLDRVRELEIGDSNEQV